MTGSSHRRLIPCPGSRSRPRRRIILYSSLLFALLWKEAEPQCELYMAPSTIPGGGLGVFAGVGFKKGDNLLSDDLAIPILDLDWHNDDDEWLWLWDEYIWTGNEFPGMTSEVNSGDISMASVGMGSVLNSLLVKVNVDKEPSRLDHGDVESSSQGVGAFTPYHGRVYTARTDIQAGDELFLSYGTNYFKSRPDTYGYIPLPKNFREADRFVISYLNVIGVKVDDVIVDETSQESVTSWQGDLWQLLLNTSVIWKQSRIMNALPRVDHGSLVDLLHAGGTQRQYDNRSRTSLEFLKSHGQCVSNLRAGRSSISDAGFGAFATRVIPEGSLISATPLIHVPDRSRLLMYGGASTRSQGQKRNISDPVHEQLLLNYCFGHEKSTLLLCPYGILTSYINHSHQSPNAKIQWSDSLRHSEWIDEPIYLWEDTMHSGLALDYIATRDIRPGEEVVIDYGEEWEVAWQAHVAKYSKTGHPNSDYQPAFVLNEMGGGLDAPNVEMACHHLYLEWQGLLRRTFSDTKCRILSQKIVKGEVRYTAELYRTLQGPKESIHLPSGIAFELPRDAFFFEDIPHARHHHQSWTFRHPMMIPDAIFPDIWKNRKA